jgi:hypothetical protein
MPGHPSTIMAVASYSLEMTKPTGVTSLDREVDPDWPLMDQLSTVPTGRPKRVGPCLQSAYGGHFWIGGSSDSSPS